MGLPSAQSHVKISPTIIYDQEKTLGALYDELDKALDGSEKKLSQEMKEDSSAILLPGGAALRTQSAKLQTGSSSFWEDYQESRVRSHDLTNVHSITCNSSSHNA